MFRRRAIRRGNESIRVLRGTRVRHITATQGIEKIPRPRAYSFIVLIAFVVAVTITNKLVAFEPAPMRRALRSVPLVELGSMAEVPREVGGGSPK